MLSQALVLQPILTTLCERAQFNKRNGVHLHRFILDDDEWLVLQQLEPILRAGILCLITSLRADALRKLFLYVTKQVSQSTVPLIHTVIPYIDTLFNALEDQSANKSNLPAVRMAAKRGQMMLKKYYGFTNYSSVYQIAMSTF